MGYDIEETIRLEFADLPGAWARCRVVSVGERLEMSGRLTRIKESIDDRNNPDRQRAMYEHMGEILSEVVVEWSMQRRGEPVPISVEGCLMLSERLLLRLYRGYMDGMIGAVAEDSELGKDSNSGGSYPAELQTMEALSPSPSN